MNWRFTILDRNDVATLIDEPIGWDALVHEINRDLEWHGVFFEAQGETFEFDGKAKELLQTEYNQYGVQGNMRLLIEEDCGAGYEEFTRGKFMFKDFDLTTGIQCYVKIPLETTSAVKELRARINQKVNLDSLIAFDETTALEKYKFLGDQIMLPSKGILLKNTFEQEKDFSTPVLGVPVNNNPQTNGSSNNSEYGMLELGFDKQKSAEIGSAGTESQLRYNCTLTNAGNLGCNSFNKFQWAFPLTNFVSPLDITAIVNYQEDTPNYGQISGVVNVDINLAMSLTNNNCGSVTAHFVLATLPKGFSGMLDSHYVYHQRVSKGAVGAGGTLSLNHTYSNASFVLNEGDRIYCYFALYHYRQNSNSGSNAFSVSINAGSYVRMQTLSFTAPTPAKVYALNECWSRVVESITNDTVRAYSNYFGRIDSQPTATIANGCGANAVVTDGIRIRRQENRLIDKPSLFTRSLQDLFEGLNPIHNIGAGIEDDPNRIGFTRLRIENWKHFYQDEVVLNCTNVAEIKRKCNEKSIYSTFTIGYNKWEAEEYTGLDEFLTKRIFRTSLSEIKNDFVKLSNLLGSGYALEITRRKGENDSKDWRYDKETFIICTKQVVTTQFTTFFAGNSFQVLGFPAYLIAGATIIISDTSSNNKTFTIISAEVDPTVTVTIVTVVESTTAEAYGSATFSYKAVEIGNVTNPENIIDPNSIYNYRISPIRNAMRWMDRVLESYRQFDTDAKLIFTDGDANYYAKGIMTDTNCRLENASIAENDSISKSNFEEEIKAKPIRFAETVEFDYPLTSQEFKLLKADPYGLIQFSNDIESGQGWISKIKYTPEEGLASFTLIPKNL